MPRDHARVKKAIRSSHWLILPEWLDLIEGIAEGAGDLQLMHEQRALYQSRLDDLSAALGNTASIGPDSGMIIQDSVAVIPVIGPVVRYADFFTEQSGMATIASVQKNIAAAKNDSKVKRVVMYYDTPGGQASGMAETSRMISELGKPVDSYVAHLGASLGYWLAVASGTGSLHAAPDSLLGSIGVRCGKCEGDDGIVSKNAPEKRDSDKGRQQVVDDLEEQFVSHVAQMRNVSEKKVKTQFGRGGVLLAPAALEVGMIDHISVLSDLIGPKKGQRSNAMPDDNSPDTQVAAIEIPTAAPDSGRAEPQADFASQLKETESKAKAEGQKAGAEEMQARLAQIFDHDAAKANTELAMHLALKTELAADAVIASLEVAGASANPAPATGPSDYQQMVAASQNTAELGDSPDAESVGTGETDDPEFAAFMKDNKLGAQV